MNSARRLQRHGRGPQLKAAVDQMRTAVGSLAAVGDLSKAIQELGQQTEQVASLAAALTEDYRSLASELEVQREVAVQLCALGSSQPLEYWRAREAEIRRQLVEQRTTNDEQRPFNYDKPPAGT